MGFDAFDGVSCFGGGGGYMGPRKHGKWKKRVWGDGGIRALPGIVTAGKDLVNGQGTDRRRRAIITVWNSASHASSSQIRALWLLGTA